VIAIGTQSGSRASAPTGTGNYTVYSQAAIVGATGNVALAVYAATDANCVAVSRKRIMRQAAHRVRSAPACSVGGDTLPSGARSV
jgi:DICT domain-containing protein